MRYAHSGIQAVSEYDAPREGSVPAQRKMLWVLPKTTEFGGVERHLLDLLPRLEAPDLDISVICFDHDNLSSRVESSRLQGLRRVAVTCRREPQSLGEWLGLIRTAHPGIIVFCYNWIEAFPWQAPVAALLAGVPKRYAIQHLIPAPPKVAQGSSWRAALRRLMGKSRRHFLSLRVTGYLSSETVCVSNAVREALVNVYGFPGSKTVTFRNGVSLENFAASPEGGAAMRARLGIASDEFLLLCAARLAPAKGVDVLLEAVSEVLRRGIPCRCLILGDGPLKQELERKAETLGIAGQVRFLGFQDDVRPYLQAASAFILTSHLEGLPLSVLEAMATGLPCIATDVGGTSEAVKNGQTGLVIPDHSVEAAADAIAYLATHPVERAEMAAKALETARREFDLETRMRQLAAVLLS